MLTSPVMRIAGVAGALATLTACASHDTYPAASRPAVPSVAVATPQVVTPAAPVAVVPPGATGSSGSSMPPSVLPRLTAGQTAALLADNTVAGIASNGQPYFVYYRRDGTIQFREGNVMDGGSWRVAEDGRVCSTLTRINYGNEECYALYRNGTNIDFARPDGAKIGTFTVEAGNPQNL